METRSSKEPFYPPKKSTMEVIKSELDSIITMDNQDYALLSHPLSVDPTFNFGKFEVMQFTYKYLFLKFKGTGLAPVFLGPAAIYYSKQRSVYSEIIHDVASNTPSLAEKGKGFKTDGEEALHSALKEVMGDESGLRCFSRFKQNCRDKLHKVFVRVVFGNSDSDGILDAKDKNDLKTFLTEAKESMDREELKLTGGRAPEFWNLC